jgi:hypothetical protein
LPTEEATGNSAYFFWVQATPHKYSFKFAWPSKEQVHEERVEVVRFMSFKSADQTFDKSSSKHLFHSFHITLNSNCEAQRASKNLKEKKLEGRVGSQK